MDTRKVDVAIIGAGTAGLNARRKVAKQGGHPLMIEGGAYGSTCARVGCIPSKLLIAAAEAAHAVKGAVHFGLHASARIDGAAVMARVQRGVAGRRRGARLAGRSPGRTAGRPGAACIIDARGLLAHVPATQAVPTESVTIIGERCLQEFNVAELGRVSRIGPPVYWVSGSARDYPGRADRPRGAAKSHAAAYHRVFRGTPRANSFPKEARPHHGARSRSS